MDAITPLAFELTAAAARAPGADLSARLPAAVFDIARFDAMYAAAGRAAAGTQPVPKVSGGENDGLRAVLVTLQGLNGRAESLGAAAPPSRADLGPLKPADMLMLTMKAHEFLFHCELTSNVANRTSDGVQQLFREQT
jgi:hypothetical protein